MKSILFLVCFFLLATVEHGAATETLERASVTNKLRMSIRIKDNERELRTNQPVMLLLRIENLSSNETFMIKRQRSTFSFIVFSPTGKLRSPKPDTDTYFGSWIFLEPGKVEQWEFDLRSRCNLDELGAYRITAKAKIVRPKKNTKVLETIEITSNQLRVSIPAVKE